MRQRIGEKKIKKYQETTGLPVCSALVRGGTEHRIDLLIKDGEIVSYWPNSGEMELAYDTHWNYAEWLLENPGKDNDYPNSLNLLDKLRDDAEKRKIKDVQEEKITRESINNMEPWLRVALGYGAKIEQTIGTK
jgi:hypothetical protein